MLIVLTGVEKSCHYQPGNTLSGNPPACLLLLRKRHLYIHTESGSAINLIEPMTRLTTSRKKEERRVETFSLDFVSL
jgi:hypothetical protein